jgi:hypothetical protein
VAHKLAVKASEPTADYAAQFNLSGRSLKKRFALAFMALNERSMRSLC